MPQPKPTECPELDTDRLLGVISYFGPLCLIPLLMKGENELTGHHAKQGLVLFIFEVALMVIVIAPFIGWLIAFFGWILAVVLSVMGIINVLAGKAWNMPILGRYAKLFKF